MHLENVVFDARDPQRLGGFWEAALGCERLTDEVDIVETRLRFADDAFLDLCFPRVVDATDGASRVHLLLTGRGSPADEVERLLGLGASRAATSTGGEPWVVMRDPQGNPFRVIGEGSLHADTGALAGIVIESADPERDARFWSWLIGWVPEDRTPTSLRHPTGRGPTLIVQAESRARDTAKSRIHLDARLGSQDDADEVAAAIADRGGTELAHPEWGDLPWRFVTDPSGNEFCLLPVPR